jgi:hypothetical protein
MDQDAAALKDELELARLEEAEALRRAIQLRAFGTAAQLRIAMLEVDAAHSRVVRLYRQRRKPDLIPS